MQLSDDTFWCPETMRQKILAISHGTKPLTAIRYFIRKLIKENPEYWRPIWNEWKSLCEAESGVAMWLMIIQQHGKLDQFVRFETPICVMPDTSYENVLHQNRPIDINLHDSSVTINYAYSKEPLIDSDHTLVEYTPNLSEHEIKSRSLVATGLAKPKHLQSLPRI